MIENDIWVLSVGVFLPIAGVLVMLFIPRREELLIKQVALLTTRIRELTTHLQTHKKDYSARRGLLVMVGRRSRLLKFLNATDRTRYLDVIQKLGIRAQS